MSKAELHGRTVERIRIDSPPGCTDPDCPPEPAYAYVEPDTLYPVEVQGPGAIGQRDGPVVWHHVVVRYLTYEYLPRTDGNLALTDIRAQHPDAIGPWAQERCEMLKSRIDSTMIGTDLQ
jgi:hypothetical protein